MRLARSWGHETASGHRPGQGGVRTLDEAVLREEEAGGAEPTSTSSFRNQNLQGSKHQRDTALCHLAASRAPPALSPIPARTRCGAERGSQYWSAH